jgi:hypothetical protein
MALKITSQIGTNRGLTSEAYIRIGSYDILKSGELQLWLQIYQNETDANQPVGETPLYKESVSLEIGSIVKVPLLKQLTRSVTKVELIDEVQTIIVPKLENGVQVGTEEKEITKKVPQEVTVEEPYSIPDMSIIEGQDIFAFGYTKLREHLVMLFGEENIVDC